MKNLLTTLLCIATCSAFASDFSEQPSTAIGDYMGTIQFPVNGNEEAKKHVERGVKLLHHMTYREADKEFAAAIEADPSCALAYWGRAMSIVHPVWPDLPSGNQLNAGWDFICKARALGSLTSRENDYIDTIAVYFENASAREEKERLIDLDKAWETLEKTYPEDVEALAFYALFHLAPSRFMPGDNTYTRQLESGLIAEDILETIPDHPGALHYQIHAYDFPALAGKALEMCGLYGEVAPNIPHALHMPTHIYTRAGLWGKSIELNLRSAKAALGIDQSIGGNGAEYLHSLDYAVLAYLQQGQYAEAKKIRDQILAIEGPFVGPSPVAAAFAFAAIPARCALEAQAWEEAAQLKPKHPAWFSWDLRYTPQQSIIYYARAIGSVRTGDLESARENIAVHKKLADEIAQNLPSTYWHAQSRTQQLSMNAWLAYQEGNETTALSMIQEAAQLESVTDKEAVTPGEVLPAGELLGDMLFEMKRFDEAIAAYEKVLERSPNRFYSLYGIARAGEENGNQEVAIRFYQLLVALAINADNDQIRLQHAKSYLANHQV